jgi:hypothetical protein
MPQIVFEREAPQQALIDAALAGSVNRPFWGDDVAHLRRSFPPLQGKASTDLAIVGGGFLGLWTAILAKERNPSRSVTLLEGRQVGWAASGRNGGFCEASITHGEENGQQRWPEEMPSWRHRACRIWMKSKPPSAVTALTVISSAPACWWWR